MKLLATASNKTAAVDLDSMTKTQLMEYAEANGAAVKMSMRKADILAAIKAAMA